MFTVAAQKEISPASSLLFKRSASWDLLKLDHYRLDKSELPEHSHSAHTVLISLTEGCPAEMRTGSGVCLAGMQRRGSICVLPAGLPHQARLDEPSEHLAMYVDPALIDRAAAYAKPLGSYELKERYTQHDPIISSIGAALLGELESEGVSGRLYAESLANVLAVHLLRHYSTTREVPTLHSGGLSGFKLRQVTEFIAENFAEDISLSDLAQVAGMSTFHFTREFKKATGTTPHQYLIKFRLDYARKLLASGDLPLVEVALRTGFSHQSHFTRLFRKTMGTTPQQYRLTTQI